MITVNFENGNSYELAEEWSEITFAQYIDMSNITQDKDMDDVDKAVKIIAHLSTNPEQCEKELYNMHKPDFEELANYFLWTNSKIEDNATQKEFIEIEGKKYRIKKDYDKITMGEFASVETLINNQKNLNPYEVVFGILLREIQPDGTEKSFNEDDFFYIMTKLKEKVMLLDIYSHINFFLSGKEKSSKTSKGFSVQKKNQSPISTKE